jgi:hypothetical protein
MEGSAMIMNTNINARSCTCEPRDTHVRVGHDQLSYKDGVVRCFVQDHM